ncbi:diguanylate cyclase (GGDEF)-like protein [Sinorhizobium fredii]
MLKKLAETVRAKLRPADLLFRYGGEEFIVLCPGIPYADVHSRAEDIRLAVSAAVKTPNGHPVTTSIGVSSTLADGARIHELLAEADIRLYAAKNTGRNCVVGR